MKQQLLELKLKEIEAIAKLALTNTVAAPSALVAIIKVVERE